MPRPSLAKLHPHLAGDGIDRSLNSLTINFHKIIQIEQEKAGISISIMTKVLGMEFAPLFIPLNRRLETLGALNWTFEFLVLPHFCTILGITLLFTRFYYITLLYALWYAIDHKTHNQNGRRSEWVRNWTCWRWFKDYFPMKLIKTVDLSTDKNYIMCYHPHGIMSVGAFCSFATEATGFSSIFPGIRPYLITLNAFFKFPFFRDYIMLTGARPATAASIKWAITECGTGNAVGLVLGGAAEALDARPGSFTLQMRRRRGFVKIALETGASLVPVFSFGENELFKQVSNPVGSRLRKVQNVITRWIAFAPPLFYGRGIFNYTFGMLPMRRPINIIVGKPIDVAKVESPSHEQIEELYDHYVDELKQLFEEHKEEFGIPEDKHIVLTV